MENKTFVIKIFCTCGAEMRYITFAGTVTVWCCDNCHTAVVGPNTGKLASEMSYVLQDLIWEPPFSREV